MGETSDRVREEFRASGRRLTTQRRLVLRVLEDSSDHLDAEMIYDQARLHDPDISLATVYRTLAVLKEMGLVEEHSLGEEHAHYEAVRDRPHYHFICRRCGEVIEFDAPLVSSIAGDVSEREAVYITDVHLRLSGYCAECQREEKGQAGNGG